MGKTIFITGATGCIGHYVVDAFLQDPDTKLFILLRSPDRLTIPVSGKNVELLVGDMHDIAKFSPQLKQADALIHIATAWGNSDETHQVNVDRTLEMFNLLDPDRCQKIVYFSTSSILDAQNNPQDAAAIHGTWYIRSKYAAYQAIRKWKHANKIVTIFPTVVFGGDGKKYPYSHISSGFIPNLKYLKWLRIFNIGMSFHVMHAKDIAAFAKHACDHLQGYVDYAFGQPAITANDVVAQLCRARRIWVPTFQIPLGTKTVFAITKLLKIQLAPWDRHCIANPRFTYQTVYLEDFGIPSSFPTFMSIYEDLEKHHVD